MRTWLVLMVAVVVGCLAGSGMTYFTFSVVENHFHLQPPGTDAVDTVVAGTPKAVVVGESEYNFGTLERDQNGKHTFVVRNDGEGPLELALGGVSCGKCIQSDFVKASLEPGESVDVEVKYATKKLSPTFNERAELFTNDGQQPLLELRIKGYVTHAVRPSVEEITLGAISGNEPTTTTLRLYGFLSDQLEVVGQEFSRPGTADLFELHHELMAREEYRDEPNALVARKLSLTIKPGLPLGPISQTIRLTVQAKTTATIEIPITGSIISDITLVGAGVNSETNQLILGNISREEGAKTSLRILVKGPYRESVELSVGEIDPADVLRATLGDRIKVGDGAVFMYPLNIEIVKGAPVTNRLGTKQGKAGKIVIDATHPTAKQLPVYVRFATE